MPRLPPVTMATLPAAGAPPCSPSRCSSVTMVLVYRLPWARAVRSWPLTVHGARRLPRPLAGTEMPAAGALFQDSRRTYVLLRLQLSAVHIARALAVALGDLAHAIGVQQVLAGAHCPRPDRRAGGAGDA